MSNEVHRKTDTLFPGNSMTVAELEPQTIQSGGSTTPHCLLKKRVPIKLVLKRECLFSCGLHYSYNTYWMVNPHQLLSIINKTSLNIFIVIIEEVIII